MKAVPEGAAFFFALSSDFVVVLILSSYPPQSPIVVFSAKKYEIANILLAKNLENTIIECTFVL